MKCIFPWLLLSTAVSAKVLYGFPENYYQLVKTLQPGDTLVLQPGTYTGGLRLHRLQGKEGRPIIITGESDSDRPVFVARRGRNTVSILDSSYVTIRNLELDGRGLPVDAVKAEGHARWAHHITLENLLILSYKNNQQSVGISTKCPAWGWVIRDNVIDGAGTGIYLGDSDGSAPFFAGLIEHNRITNTIGYNLQIKHQHSRGYVPGLSDSSDETVIRYNRFSKEKNAAEGPMARPNVLLGHWPITGFGMSDRYLVYRNLFYGNPHEALFQGEGNIALYNNIFVNHHGDAIHIQPHNDVPKRVDIFSNSVVARGDGIVIRRRENDFRFKQYVVGNAVFASTPLKGGEQNSNVTERYEAAGDYLADPYQALGQLDLHPKPDKLIDTDQDLSRFQQYQDWDLDFDGGKRRSVFVGAYKVGIH